MGYRAKTIIFLSAEFLVFFLAGIFLVRSVFLRIGEISRGMASEGEKISLTEKKIENFQGSFGFLEQGAAEKMKILFADKAMPVDFIGFLEKAAADEKLSLQIVSISTSREEKKPWPSLTFQIKNKGDFASFSAFLKKLETGPYLAEIKELDVKRLNSPTQKEVESTFSFNVFTQ